MSLDQAAGLRRMLGRPALRVLPLVSPMGGAAQAALALRIAAALSQLGSRVVLLDASRGEVIAALGIAPQGPRGDLLQLLEGEKEFSEVVLAAPQGLRVVPAERGIAALDGGGTGFDELFGAFAALHDPADLVLLNCAPGDARTACRAAQGGRELVLALHTDAASVTGAYGLIKSVRGNAPTHRFRLLFAEASRQEAGALFARMREAAQRFLAVELSDGGAIPRLPAVDACRGVANASYGWDLPEYVRNASTASTA